MTNRVSQIKSHEIYGIEEDTIIEGNIETGAQVQLKNGASLHVLGSILDNVSIKEIKNEARKITGLTLGPGNSFSENSEIFDNKTGEWISLSRFSEDLKKASGLEVDGNIGNNIHIYMFGSYLPL